jgi:hypothetical protein
VRRRPRVASPRGGRASSRPRVKRRALLPLCGGSRGRSTTSSSPAASHERALAAEPPRQCCVLRRVTPGCVGSPGS